MKSPVARDDEVTAEGNDIAQGECHIDVNPMHQYPVYGILYPYCQHSIDAEAEELSVLIVLVEYLLQFVVHFRYFYVCSFLTDYKSTDYFPYWQIIDSIIIF